MKKTLFTAALAAAFGLVAMQASAADGTITFTGLITDTTCTVTGGTGTDGAAQNITVAMPTVSVTALKADGQRAGDTPFSLVIGGSGQTGCTNGKVVSLRFEPAQSPMIDATTGRLKNSTAAGMATLVEVAMLNAAKSDINLYTSANSTQATIANNTATLNYWAQYVATGGASTAGTVNTNVVYSLTYN